MSQAPVVPSGSRVVDGQVIPEAGTWAADPSHSSFEFVARHLTSKVRGRFHGVTGTATIAEQPEESTVAVENDVNIFYTHEPRRDGPLKSPYSSHFRSAGKIAVRGWNRRLAD